MEEVRRGREGEGEERRGEEGSQEEGEEGRQEEGERSEENTSEVQSPTAISYAAFCLNNKKISVCMR